MDLPLNDERVDHRSAVVHDDVAHPLDRRSLNVDVEHADVAPISPLKARRIEDLERLQHWLFAGRQIVRQVRYPSEVPQGQAGARRPANARWSLHKLDVV